MKNQKYYTIGEAAKIVGCHRRTLYYWEKTGKVKRAKRNPMSKYRLYTAEEVEQLKRLYNGRQ